MSPYGVIRPSEEGEGGPWTFQSKSGLAIVLTHDCTIDKSNTRFVQICPISPLKDLEPSLRGEVKKNRPFQYFYLPPDGELTESFVDFAYPTTVSLSMVSGIPRLMTLSDLGRRALYVQYIRWVTRWEMRKIKCPGCGEDFNASAALPVRKD